MTDALNPALLDHEIGLGDDAEHRTEAPTTGTPLIPFSTISPATSFARGVSGRTATTLRVITSATFMLLSRDRLGTAPRTAPGNPTRVRVEWILANVGDAG